MNLLLFGAILPWIIIGVGCWIGVQLVRQNGRILMRLEALEERLAQPRPPARESTLPVVAKPAPAAPPAGLPVGIPAPDFDLPDLSGARGSLADWRGRRLLLVFFNPQCGFCTQMAPDLAALSAETSGETPIPLIVSTGDAGQNRQLVEKHGIRCPVLLQQQMEVAAQYQVGGTPMGYLINEQGAIASPVAVGSRALLDLVQVPGVAAPTPAVQNEAPTETHRAEHKGNRSLADSHLNRNGLPAGTPAPGFLLPRVGGGELSLEQYRGQRVLLVFSDPKCGPCDQLAPKLEQLHRQRADLQVLMVSRGAMEINQQKIAQGGLTFPVVLQNSWEISRAYAMFATPIAYLIDERGIVAANVGVGPEAILGLADARSPAEREVAAI
jgi:peroxiredoxin